MLLSPFHSGHQAHALGPALNRQFMHPGRLEAASCQDRHVVLALEVSDWGVLLKETELRTDPSNLIQFTLS